VVVDFLLLRLDWPDRSSGVGTGMDRTPLRVWITSD
jgi:hypothetical protein